MTLSNLVESIDTQRQQGNHTSALRLFDLDFYRSQNPEAEGSETLRVLMERPKPLLLSLCGHSHHRLAVRFAPGGFLCIQVDCGATVKFWIVDCSDLPPPQDS